MSFATISHTDDLPHTILGCSSQQARWYPIQTHNFTGAKYVSFTLTYVLSVHTHVYDPDSSKEIL